MNAIKAGPNGRIVAVFIFGGPSGVDGGGFEGDDDVVSVEGAGEAAEKFGARGGVGRWRKSSGGGAAGGSNFRG